MSTEIEGGHVGTAVDVVAYGRAATEALAARIATAKAVHPLDDVTVIVPSNRAGLSARRLLAGGALDGPGLANVDFVTPLRLAELLGATAIGVRRPLTNAVLASTARRVLAAEPGPFTEVAHHQATQAALVALYAALSRALPASLATIAAATPRGAAAVRLVGAMRSHLGAYHDEDDLAAAATRRVVLDPGVTRSLGAVVWHLPGRLSPAVQQLVAAVLAATPSSVVVGLTGEADADAAVVEVLEAVGVELPTTTLRPAPHRPHADRVISVSDPDEEARTVVREVVALATEGVDLDRVAVFLPAAEPYARTLVEHLDAAGIPHNGPATARLVDSVAGRTLLAALALPGLGWRRADVTALLAGAPIRHAGRPAPSGRWDALSREAGVVGGLDDWRVRSAGHGGQLLEQRTAMEEAGGAPAARSERLADDAESAAALGRFVHDLAAALADLDAQGTWKAKVAAAQALLGGVVGPEHRRTSWPDGEVDAAARVDAALSGLAVLDEIEPQPTPATFEQAVRVALEATTGRVGRFGEGVLVAPLAASVGLDLDAVFVVGMVEGTCPSFPRDDALLPDVDRHLAVGGELVTRAQRLADQHRAYLAALAAGRRRATLLLPRGDLRDRRHRTASRWAVDTIAHHLGRPVFSGEVAELVSGGEAAGIVEVVASYAAGVAGAHVHGSVTDRDVAALLADTGDPLDHPLIAGAVARGFTCHRAREGSAFTEWDGNLAGQALPSPTPGAAVSPSRLETWAACPFRYFLHHVLHLDERDDPEDVVEIGGHHRGSLVHEVLETFLTEVLHRDAGPPRPDEAWTGEDRHRLRAIAEDVCERYEDQGLTGRALLWRRHRAALLEDLDAFLTSDDHYRRSEGATPAGVELPFGLDGRPPLAVELPDGRGVAFRGYADRVDTTEGGHLVVLDYKTGRNRYDGLDDDPVLAGTSLQLGVYAEAAAVALGRSDVDARYWMTSRKERFEQRGYRWDDERRGRFLDVVGAIVDGVEGGTFPARPGAYDPFWASHENCRHCPFDRVCPRDRDDHATAKADAPELSLLAVLAASDASDAPYAPEEGERGGGGEHGGQAP